MFVYQDGRFIIFKLKEGEEGAMLSNEEWLISFNGGFSVRNID